MKRPGQYGTWWVGLLMGTACFLVLASVVVEVAGHSWIACTDYRIEKPSDENYYNPDNCKGYPRGFSKFDRGFGRDMGYNNQVPPGAKLPQPCHPRAPMTQPLWDAYTDAYPMAQYAPGQNVCLAWPSKNHVAASCTNQWIPDLGNQLFMSKKNPTRDPTQTEFEGNLLADLGKNPVGKVAFQGFQHCPKFCEDNDKSLCTGCFTVPKNIEPGIYTIEWYWTFTPTLAYTSCFEVMIGKPDGAKRSGGAGPSGDNSKVDVSRSPDTLAFKKVPAEVPLNDFQIDVVYNAAADRQLIVELWSGMLQKIPAMTGSVSVKTGYRTATVKVSPLVKGVDPKEFTGMQLTLRAYLVSAEDYRTHPFNPSSFEIYRKEAIVTLGDSLSYSTNQEEGVEDAPPSDDDDSASKWWIVLGVGLGVAAVVAAVAGYLLHKRRRKVAVTIDPSGDYRLMQNA